jgi:S-adenosylmethionine uptake transporter
MANETGGPATERPNDASRAIGFVLLGVLCISVNDMLVKHLSGGYPLHQTVFIRSLVAISASLAILQFEGGFAALRTDRPGLHLLRGVLIVFANMAFFSALATLPLADATALFFVAPLFITILAIPLLGETVGARRLGAVAVGFLGVVVMTRPGAEGLAFDRALLLLPVLAALAYAGMQILTRRLGVASPASAMAIYIQGTFIAVSLLFWAIAGDGRFAEGLENESARFLLRAWVWPEAADWPLFGLLGVMSAVIGYSLSQAYRSAEAAVVAPFEYTALPLSIFWGWAVFGELPDLWGLAGIGLIGGAGVYVFLRERRRKRPLASARPTRRV